MAAREGEGAGNKSDKLRLPPIPRPRPVLGRSLSCCSIVTFSESDQLNFPESLEAHRQSKAPQPNSDTQDDAAVNRISLPRNLENKAAKQELDQTASSRSSNPNLSKAQMKENLPTGRRNLTSEDVNQRADDFIAGFLKQMRLERQESYELYQQQIDRSR